MVTLLAWSVIIGFVVLSWLSARHPDDPDPQTLIHRQLDTEWKKNPVAVRRGRVYNLHDPSIRGWEEWR